MKYPALVIHKEHLKQNIAIIKNLCQENGISMTAVTKCICSIPELTQVYVDAGVTEFGDSRIENLKKLSYAGINRWLLRIPMHSECAEVVRHAEISCNSEISTMEKLSEEALKINRRHKIILMADLGDLREGVMVLELPDYVEKIVALKGIELIGLGVNLNCYGGIIPTVENLSQLLTAANEIKSRYGVELPIISGGNSGSIHLLTSKTMPVGITNIRVGEGILIGCETSYQQQVLNANLDVFTLHAEIVELKEKPSVPIGESGLDAFGEKQIYPDRGMMKRAIVACGRQDVSADKILPLDCSIEIIGQSSDHMIIDVTNASKAYSVGDVLTFSTSYGAVLSLCTSEYVNKILR